MEVLNTIVTIVHIVDAVVIIALILLQSGKPAVCQVRSVVPEKLSLGKTKVRRWMEC